MNLKSILLLLLALPQLQGQGTNEPFAEAALTSRHLIPGEQASLIIRIRGGQPDRRPAPPEIPGTAVNFVREVTQLDEQRRLTRAFLYRLTPAIVGKFTVPSITLRSSGKPLQTPPLKYQVYPTSELISLPTTINGQHILSGWYPEKTTLYPGEQCPITLKLYTPKKLRIVNWGMPDPVKTNCLAWRFSSPNNYGYSQIHIHGIAHISAEYRTNLSGISPGEATFGPSKLRLIVRKSQLDPRIGTRIVDTPIELNLPALDFKILPFPDGAPKGFNGAVGQFNIEAQCENITLRETESTEVILNITGRGNLETLRAPILTGNSWKIIDTAKVTRDTERRYLSGQVTFQQIIRPLSSSLLSIPPYSFSYFDPNNKKYHTLTTPEIPVHITPASTPPLSENNSSSADTDDILPFINSPSIPHSIPETKHPIWQLWHLTPALLCLIILTIPIRKKVLSNRIKHPDAERKRKAIKKLTTTGDTRTFYRRAGRYIDQWLRVCDFNSPNIHHDQLQEILAKRDALCFQPESTELDAISSDRKKEIINLLKQSSKLTLALLFFLTINHAHAEQGESSTPSSARESWERGQYQNAINFYRQSYPQPSNTPADILYNIGNCHYHLSHPGHAALAWRRALLTDPTHLKARQNLRYLETKHRSQVPTYPHWQELLAQVHPHHYQTLFYAALWLIALIILTLIFLKPKRIKLTLCITLLIIATLIAILAALARHWYPDDHTFAPPQSQAVTFINTNLYKEAHHLQQFPLTVPAASLVRIIATRGSWTHIQTTEGEKGWVENEKLGKLSS